MTKEFKLRTEYVPFIGIGIGIDKSSMYKGIAILLPFVSFSILVRCKDPNELWKIKEMKSGIV